MSEENALDDKWSPPVRELLLRYYPDYSPRRFADLLNQHIHSSACVLEIGAGSGRNHQTDSICAAKSPATSALIPMQLF